MERVEAEDPAENPWITLAQKALKSVGLAAQGWRLVEHRWIEANRLVFLVEHLEWGRIAVELFEAKRELAAYARGDLYGSATRRGPGLIDVNDDQGAGPPREAALRLAQALSVQVDGPSFGDGSDPATEPALPPHLEGAALVEALKEALERTPVRGLDAWEGPTLSAMTRWAEVAEIAYEDKGANLVFIVSPQEESRPAFKRGRSYELVYYSDDLKPSEHEALYERDQEAIEAFARWFLAWDL